MKRWLLLPLVLTFAVGISACAWDDDTLAAEVNGLPTVADAIVGRIEVNPPLYYERRIQLSTARIAKNSSDFEAYDNLAVAYDKLGKFSEAMSILARKRAAMEGQNLKPKPGDSRDPWYRYHANLGTVLAHEWVRRQPKADQKHLKEAIRQLERSIEINPDAHFGREIVQVKILQMLNRKFGSAQSETDYLPEGDWHEFVNQQGAAKVIEGVIGMMALGAGADSPEMISLIGASLGNSDGHLTMLTKLRLQEMAEAKQVPKFIFEPVSHDTPRDERGVEQTFLKLRANAQTFRANREAFMDKKLKAGQHPDSHPEFWKGYVATPRLKLVDPPKPPRLPWPEILAGVGVIAGGGAILLLIRKYQPKRPLM